MNKNDPGDDRPVAVAALRSPGVREVRADDHAAVLKVRSERYRDLGRTRTQVVCRLHAVLCELVPGGVSKAITAGLAARLPGTVMPPDEVAAARCEPAVEVRDVLRFPGRGHFVAANGTAPAEVSSGPRKTCRLGRRGNRRLSHAVHMAAVTQIRCRQSKGRACHGKKLAGGKTPEEALWSLNRQVSNAIFACLHNRRRGQGAVRPSERSTHQKSRALTWWSAARRMVSVATARSRSVGGWQARARPASGAGIVSACRAPDSGWW